MESTRTGHCHCGAITVTLPASAFGVVACHCEDCQKLHGNYFAMIAAPAAEVAIVGADQLRWYASSASVRRSFCAVCGSRVAKEPLGSGRLLVSVGLFGKHTGLHIHKNVFSESKPDWYTLPGQE